MSTEEVGSSYTVRKLQALLGLSRGVIDELVESGYVSPSRGARNELRFSFQDVVLLRTAYQLQAANIPRRRLMSSLRQLRLRLPAQLPLSGLRIRAIGNQVVVLDGASPWEAGTGQLLLDFEVSVRHGAVAFLPHGPPAASPETASAEELLRRGERLEEQGDALGAEAAYRDAVAADPTDARPAINLVALLCDVGRCGDAADHYQRAAQACPDDPLLHFNGAIALEDMERLDQARACYERCLTLDAKFADAHFNIARLCYRLGDPRGTLRHYNAYRRLLPRAEYEATR